jgi:hypothetical protein
MWEHRVQAAIAVGFMAAAAVSISAVGPGSAPWCHSSSHCSSPRASSWWRSPCCSGSRRPSPVYATRPRPLEHMLVCFSTCVTARARPRATAPLGCVQRDSMQTSCSMKCLTRVTLPE